MDIWVQSLTAIAVASITGYLAYMAKKQEREKAELEAKQAAEKAEEARLRAEEKKQAEQEAAERREESLLIMQMLDANSELTDCLTMIMMTGDSSICNVQEAKQRLADAKANYRAFLEKIRIEKLH